MSGTDWQDRYFASADGLRLYYRDYPTPVPGRLPVQGGVPSISQGQCGGGIGVSGVKSPEDEVVAIAGRAALLGA